MAYVVTDGQIMGLNRPSLPRFRNVQLALTYSVGYAEIYRTQPHVRTVIDFLARNISQIGIQTFERVSITDRKRLYPADHPLAALLWKPNPRTTQYRWLTSLVSDLGIYDVACHAKIKVETAKGLLRLPPEQLEPLGENWAWADGVRLKGNKGVKDFGADEIVLFHGYNPLDARWGLSPMETLRQILAEEYQANQYRSQLWANGARFPGHIERPAGAEWSDKARERFRSDWKGLYTGDGPSAGGTPILEDGMKFLANGVTPAQAQYLETRKLTREEVASAFHIPPPMVGILDHATFSNIEEQHKNLYQDTLGPWLEMIQQEYELQLVPDFDTTGKVYVEFNFAAKMKGSFEEESGSLQTATGAPWLTRNEARARQNLPALPGGDDLVTPLNVLVGGQASPTDSAPKSAEPRTKAAPITLRKARAPETHEAKYREIVSAFFARQKQVVVSKLGAKAAADWWDAERWDRELGGDLYALALQTTKTVAAAVMESLGADAADYDEDVTLAFLATVTKRVAGSVNQATKAQLDAALEADDPTEAVATVFDAAEGSRTKQIAVTAVTAMSGFATVEAAKQASGGTATKTWETGSNPRSSHASMNGETVGIDEAFSNGLMWPGDGGDADEVAGCNCDVSIDIPA